MPNIAKGSDGIIYYADDFKSKYSGKFFCANEECGCELILKNRGTEEKTGRIVKTYFSATPSNPHLENCIYKSNSLDYEELKNSNFSTDSFFSNILDTGLLAHNKKGDSPTGTSNKNTTKVTKKINTVNQFWTYCKQHSDEHILPDGILVKEIYQEERSKHFGTENRRNNRIVLLEFKNCNWTPDKMDGYFKIWCYFPYENNKPKPKMFSLKFESHTIFIEIMKYFCERLSAMKNRGEKTFLVAAGEWSRNSCIIKSKKQIHIVNPKSV